jgi:hypothetical protein
MVIPFIRGISAESEKKYQLCVLGGLSAAPRGGMQARAVNPYLLHRGAGWTLDPDFKLAEFSLVIGDDVVEQHRKPLGGKGA